jgi:broad specificity phosphatase PhoE
VPAVIFVRHAQASYGGPDYDVLSDLGHEQCRVLAAEIDARGILKTRMISGPGVRHRETAACVAGAAEVTVMLDDRWDEYLTDAVLEHHGDGQARLSGGGAEGLTSREFQRSLDRALHDWIGSGAQSACREPWAAFRARVVDAANELDRGLARGETAVVSTSAGVIAAICVARLGLPDTSFVAFNRVQVNTGITKVIIGSAGSSLVSFNEHSHLDRQGPSFLTYR